jgi:hypothetical protein
VHLKACADLQESGNWAHDNLVGREFAADLVSSARANQDPHMVAFAMRSVAKSDRWGGVEVGFAFGLARELIGSR